MIKMVVFDMAGTTVNENNVVYKTLHTALNESGYSFTFEQVLLEGAGKEKLQAIKSILHVYAGKDDDILASRIYQRFIDNLATAYQIQHIYPQHNVLQLFHALRQRNIIIILNTGYNRDTAQLIIDKLGWESGVVYDTLITSTDVAYSRPSPDMVWLAMKKFDITNAAEVVKVGDSITDIEEGRNAGCGLTIGITTGAHTFDQLLLAKPDYIINNLMELLVLLN